MQSLTVRRKRVGLVTKTRKMHPTGKGRHNKEAHRKRPLKKQATKKRFSDVSARAQERRSTSQFPRNAAGARFQLAKYPNNPIISPRRQYDWEARQTFNPAAVLINHKVHFLYRAIGSDMLSRLGYANSSDGLAINERLQYPVYSSDVRQNIHKTNFSSGGGWGGVEDPRLTAIEGRLNLLHVLLSGIPQLAITSIAQDDFVSRRWKWSQTVTISPPGVVVKSGCLFPEKVGGRYVILYRIFPDIWIDYVDSLEFQRGQYLKGRPVIKIRENEWDSRKIGAGAPPIKTPNGWLLIYYAVDEKELEKYKIGAMILDAQNPERVLHRSAQPILEPTEWYENQGHKSGITYPCGAVVKDKKLLVYYGGADSYVCVAWANFNEFMHALLDKSQPVLTKGILGMEKT